MPGMTCPRRIGEPGPWERIEGLDSWERRGGLAGQGWVGTSCSFCGSLNPDRFMELVREGWLVGPTDKTYKAYLAKPYSEHELAGRKARWMATDRVAAAIRELGESDGKTAEQIEADMEREWTDRCVPLMTGETLAKFYFQHLTVEQRHQFIDLYNSHRMRLGYPGRLYIRPFFCGPARP